MLIAQISDTHVKRPGRLAYGRVDTATMLSTCVEHLRHLQPRPDLLLVTGDLVDGGDPAEYAHFQQLIAPLPIPVLVIAGNHDDRDVMRQSFASATYLPASGFLHYTIDQGPLRFIGLDTLIPGEGGGMLCEQRLSWLEHALTEAAQRPTLVMMHHPPFETGIEHMDEKGLIGAEEYAGIISRNPQVLATLCGHLHRMIVTQVGGRPAMTVPSPAHQVELGLQAGAPSAFRMEPPGLVLHRWNGSQLVSHQTVIGSYPGPFPFFDAMNRLID